MTTWRAQRATPTSHPRFVCIRLLGSLAARFDARVARRIVRRASFTAASVGKALATSGSSRTRFVPARSRRTYFPRTPPFMDAKSYSARIWSRSGLLAFFIGLALTRGRWPRADDSDGVAPIRMRNNDDTTFGRLANGYEPMLPNRVIGIGIRRRERILQDRPRFMEIDTMLADVLRCLLWIPLEVHTGSIAEPAPSMDRQPPSCSTTVRGSKVCPTPGGSAAKRSSNEDKPPWNPSSLRALRQLHLVRRPLLQPQRFGPLVRPSREMIAQAILRVLRIPDRRALKGDTFVPRRGVNAVAAIRDDDGTRL